jgi:regulator of sigma D
MDANSSERAASISDTNSFLSTDLRPVTYRNYRVVESRMLESCRNAQERWGGVHLLIDRWLQDRVRLIGAHAAATDVTDKSVVHLFCEMLVDYVSAGHFEIYQQLTEEAQAFGDHRGLEKASQIYPRIEVTTEAALAFNDHCDQDNADTVAIRAQFNQLGELLQERFALEDLLIEILHTAHKQQTDHCASRTP